MAFPLPFNVIALSLIAPFRLMIGMNVFHAVPLDAGTADRVMTVVVVVGAMSAGDD